MNLKLCHFFLLPFSSNYFFSSYRLIKSHTLIYGIYKKAIPKGLPNEKKIHRKQCADVISSVSTAMDSHDLRFIRAIKIHFDFGSIGFCIESKRYVSHAFIAVDVFRSNRHSNLSRIRGECRNICLRSNRLVILNSNKTIRQRVQSKDLLLFFFYNQLK